MRWSELGKQRLGDTDLAEALRLNYHGPGISALGAEGSE